MPDVPHNRIVVGTFEGFVKQCYVSLNYHTSYQTGICDYLANVFTELKKLFNFKLENSVPNFLTKCIFRQIKTIEKSKNRPWELTLRFLIKI